MHWMDGTLDGCHIMYIIFFESRDAQEHITAHGTGLQAKQSDIVMQTSCNVTQCCVGLECHVNSRHAVSI